MKKLMMVIRMMVPDTEPSSTKPYIERISTAVRTKVPVSARKMMPAVSRIKPVIRAHSTAPDKSESTPTLLLTELAV